MFSRIYKTAGIALTLGFGAVVANAAPTLNPANGHYYEVFPGNGITWDAADTAAGLTNFLGTQGHLATLTSAAEDTWVDQLRHAALTGSVLSQPQTWVGGYQDPANPANGDGWKWVNGEGNFVYTNWAGGEPNGGTTENHLTQGRYGLGGGWNDEGSAPLSIGGYIVEYDVAPKANDDTVITDPLVKSGETINVDVLGNDELNGQTVASIATTPSPGATATVVGTAPNLSVDYTSAPAFGGTDTFTYTITDTEGDDSNTATVTIEVDGSVSVTPPGDDIPIFGGASSGVSLLATGELAQNSGESSVACGCTVRDSRVYTKTRNGVTTFKHRYRIFDVGAAMTDPSLASAGCAELASPGPNKLFVPIHVSVHTEPGIADQDLTLDDFRFGLCLVETGVEWSGPVHLDVDASDSVGYDVDCKAPTGGVGAQPLTMGLTTFPEEFTAPFMRPVTVECDPRGVAKWSTWYFIPNATHLPDIWPSKLYVHTMFYVLRGMIYVMEQQDAVQDNLLNDIKSEVEYAQQLIAGWYITPQDATNSMIALDDAAKLLLPPNADPGAGFYPGSGAFPNPKGELASHVMALRYAVCSELANVNTLGMCGLDPAVEALLPPLPGTTP